MASGASPPPSSSSRRPSGNAAKSNKSPPKPIVAAKVTSLPHRNQQAASSSSSSFSTAAPAAPPRAPLPSKPKAVALTPATSASSGLSPSSSSKASAVKAAPPIRVPAPPVDRMAMAAVISPNPMPELQQPKMSMTSKEWVIPPRPKPGRKPATDTPPTKRKAQNRAAQRAFRERRAARVGELEELLDQQKDEQEKQEGELKEKIHDLELDLQSFRSRCMLLENMLNRERQERIRTEKEAETLRQRLEESNFRARSMTNHQQPHYEQPHNQAHQQHRHSVAHIRQPQSQAERNFAISQIITPPETIDSSKPDDSSETHLTCGNCTLSGRCACAEEVLASAASACGKCFGTSCQCLDQGPTISAQGADLKRPISPSVPVSVEKRHRPSLIASTETETDFTAIFSRKPTEMSSHSQFQSGPSNADMPSGDSMGFKDSCGFCKDGTYCVCADTAMATPAMTPTETLPPLSHQTQTPPPSEADIIAPPIPMEMTAEGAVKLPKRRLVGNLPGRSMPQPKTSSGCGANGPGTCAQCQADPKSGLFCRLMAAKFDREGGPSAGGCCGGKGAGGGCCKSAPKQEKITLPSLPSLGLSCAEAYQTLSSHRNFQEAADDIGSWLPKLKATPLGGARAAAPTGRMPIEVEAASIMSVLKEFDVRFGREC